MRIYIHTHHTSLIYSSVTSRRIECFPACPPRRESLCPFLLRAFIDYLFRGKVRSHQCIAFSVCHLIEIKSRDKDALKNNKRHHGRARLRSFRAAYVEIRRIRSRVSFS